MSGRLLRRPYAGGEELDELGSPSRSSASLSEGWWEKMLVGGGAEAEILEPVVKILD